MKLMEKLKNALFEEEYVEVEEKPKVKKESRKEKVKIKQEKPVAKKIAVPPSNRKEMENEETSYEQQEIEKREEELLKSDKEFRFPVMEEDDFSITQPMDIIDFEEEKEVKVSSPAVEKTEEKPLYHMSREDYDYSYTSKDYPKAYERKPEHTGFKPSPIISPIYGVLDKNYRKEEVKDKKEVRISSFSREELDLDAVRKKAYGDLTEELENLPNTKKDEIIDFEEEEEEKDNLLVDLSSEDAPTVNKVTVGDAEEYFEDLGLEYNKDYIDASIERSGRRKSKEEVEPVPVKEEKEVSSNAEDEDNLFDLIDSMYNEE